MSTIKDKTKLKADDEDCANAPCSDSEESEMSAEEALKLGINVVGCYAFRSSVIHID